MAEPLPSRHRAWRCVAAAAGILVISAAGWALHAPLASMASYTAGLMALNQLAPPLLLLALPCGLLRQHEEHRLMSFAFDPFAATALFVGVSIAVSLPGLFDPSLVNALYASPLGAMELLSGLLFWAHLMPATRTIRQDWLVAFLAWFATLPMTAIAVVWMLSPDILYTPYLDIVCRWNISPLADQRWAGLVMLVAGMPLPLWGLWVLLCLSTGNIEQVRREFTPRSPRRAETPSLPASTGGPVAHFYVGNDRSA